jgi:hypothetical protein
MPLVVVLRGVNVGGHQTFRPTRLAHELRRFEMVNIGAAGASATTRNWNTIGAILRVLNGAVHL